MSGFCKPNHKWHLKLSQIYYLYMREVNYFKAVMVSSTYLPMAYPHNPQTVVAHDITQ